MKRLNLKRRVKGITDYKKRLNLLKSGKTRLVVRKTANNIVAQLIDYVPEGDKVILTVDMKSIRANGWRAGVNTPASYLIGYALGIRAKEHKISNAILDTGRHAKSSKIFAVVKGAIDAGLKVPMGEGAAPSEARISGSHITAYQKDAKGHQFAKYKSEKIDIAKDFDKVLAKMNPASGKTPVKSRTAGKQENPASGEKGV
ncbi:MAG: 50S ribosomal protein L18 [Candidatus Altiarchaeota archaeon]|nr:50S ribosomal protein L18 [Candidatus Altiarchaeota archaeon]